MGLSRYAPCYTVSSTYHIRSSGSTPVSWTDGHLKVYRVYRDRLSCGRFVKNVLGINQFERFIGLQVYRGKDFGGTLGVLKMLSHCAFTLDGFE